MEERILNVSPSIKDARDWQYGNIVKGISVLPPTASLLEYCGDIRDQGEVGFCYAFAGCQIKNIQEAIETGHKWNFSPLDLAKHVKEIDGIEGEGSTVINVMKALYEFGTIQEDFCEYEQYKKESLNFPKVANENKIPRYKSGNYARCETLEDAKQAIYNKKPVQIGYLCGENLFKLKNNSGTYVELPFNISYTGHSGTFVAYDDDKICGNYKGAMLCTNSWNTTWGDNGFFWMPYEYITFKTKDFGMKFVFDMFTTVDLKNDNLQGKVIELFINKNYVYDNGKKIDIDQCPVIDKTTSRALVPIRVISEVLGYKVEWYEPEKRITILNNGTKITLYIDKKYAWVNGTKIVLDKEPIVGAKSNRALVPLRFIAEELGCTVLWDGLLNKVTILKR